MNVNADQAATAIAETLGADLVLLSDVSGILDGKGQKIKALDGVHAQKMIDDGIITDGMIVKVNAALEAAATLRAPRWMCLGVMQISCIYYLMAKPSARGISA